MMRQFDHVVVGAGPAGGAAAIELAGGAPAHSVALVGAEPYAPYERPPLSKSTLLSALGDEGPQCLFGGIDGLAAAGVTTFIPAHVCSIDRSSKIVHLSSGERLAYGKLLLATGTSARRLQIPGADLPGLHYLRTYRDAIALAPAIRHGCSLVVIGGGFIGLEVASTARRAACNVVVVEAGAQLMGRAVPKVIADRMLDKFRSEGVDVRLDSTVAELRGTGEIASVVLGNGELLPADVVLAGIGAVPNDTIAKEAGLDVDNGIVADLHGRTSDPDVFAAGDVANRIQEVSGLPHWPKRLEAWEPALEQGVAAARAMLGQTAEPAKAPWVWSDQFDWNLQFAGYGELANLTIERHGPGPDVLTLFQLRGRRLVGVVTLNDPRSMAYGRRAVLQQTELDPARLADPSIPVKDALRGAAPAAQTIDN
ncbi:pyridine nucleotide-disulfide oxidoreductase family protein [Burkholderia pseudomallei]|nr:pyridine nucleotide-disulfide oxidoreductase family protein [Burkholderia pseudomallei]